jgi:hypothetical protein
VLAGARGYSNGRKIRSHVPWDIGGLMKTGDGGRTFQRSTSLCLGIADRRDILDLVVRLVSL